MNDNWKEGLDIYMNFKNQQFQSLKQRKWHTQNERDRQKMWQKTESLWGKRLRSLCSPLMQQINCLLGVLLCLQILFYLYIKQISPQKNHKSSVFFHPKETNPENATLSNFHSSGKLDTWNNDKDLNSMGSFY